ncbi:interferon alpha-13 [Microcaecilia unicolor]|uniref:Interferon alpha-13-like n=1 Tax=Microcaecilia unicolor TaxID=1415580 RepID=A0A6P7ZVE4_9AMPH|nr:interferon alpha-13-like [Microcaecilia unicolor]
MFLWRVCLASLLWSLIFSLKFDWYHLLVQQQHLSSKSLELLEGLGERLPCSREQSPCFRFPQNIASVLKYSEIKAAMLPTLYEILHHILKIYNEEESKMPWDRTQLEHFTTVLHWQNTELKKYLSVQLPASALGSHRKNSLKVKKFFEKLRKYLKTKDYSGCAWEAVRDETQQCLQYIYSYVSSANPLVVTVKQRS